MSNKEKRKKMKNLTKISIIFMLVASSLTMYAQGESEKFKTMNREEIMQLSLDDLLELSMENLLTLAQKLGISIDELLNMKTNVASKTTFSPRETPGIVSIVTKDEIRLSGARDFIDVLRLIPGFEFGYDVQGVVGVGLRGNWVHEGKILLLIDGQQMNELSYNNIPFGNHFPVDQIKRVEIIRGPGSAIYGGSAELGVINIITKNGIDIKGAEISGTYGQMEKSMGRMNVNANTGFSYKEWDISAKVFFGKANRSDQIFTEYIDSLENTIDLSDGGSEIQSQHLNFGAKNKNLSMRLIYDDYKTYYNYFDKDLEENHGAYNEFRSILGELKYDLKISDNFSITPIFNYKFSRPYYEQEYWRNFYVNRYSGTILGNYKLNNNIFIVAGIEGLSDNAKCLEDSGYFYSNGKNTMQLHNLAVFTEGTIKIKKLNLIAGIRTENNSEYGLAFAPRIGATSVFNKFHFKTLFSGAYRSPTVGNIDVASEIKAERSFVSEIEFGYRINDHMFVTANVFDIQINNSIIYYDNGGWDPGIDWGYKNSDNTGSNGLELEFKMLYEKGFASVNYSYYTQTFRKVPELYMVSQNKKTALALPQNKISINLNYSPVRNLRVGPTLIVLGKRYGYNATDDYDEGLISEFDASYLLNLALTYDNLIRKGISMSIAVHDILNQKPIYIQPYNGWFHPYPGRSREIILKLVISTEIFK
jgi:outer membrane receptor for ferrienterochelin and colicin